MNNSRPLGIIVSRCKPDAQEFDQIPDALFAPEGKDLISISTSTKHSIRAYYHSRHHILWLDGANMCAHATFHALVNDPSAHGGEQLYEFMQSLLNKTGSRLGIPAINDIVLILHPGGKQNTEYYTQLRQQLHTTLNALQVKGFCKFASSAIPEYSRDSKRFLRENIIPSELAGLHKEGIKDAGTIRSFLNEIKEDEIRPTLFDKAIEFEQKWLTSSEVNNSMLFTDLQSLIPDLIDAPTIAQYQEWLSSFLHEEATVGTDTVYYAKPDCEPPARNITETKFPDNAFSRAIQSLVTDLGDQCKIVYLGLEALKKGNFETPYAFDEEKKEKDDKNKEPVKPRVFITLFDIVNDQLAERITDDVLPRLYERYRFFDSSIWFRMLPIFAAKSRQEEVVSDIQLSLERNLFQIPQCGEARNLMRRLFNQSFVVKINEQAEHGQRVAPWVFHSEYLSKKKIRDLQADTSLEGLKWNIVLVDDHAQSKLPRHHQSKTTLINETLQEYLPHFLAGSLILNEQESLVSVGQATAHIEAAGSIASGEKWHDVILLDYLLLNNGYSEFSDEIIRAVYNMKELFPGPLKKICFFPITVYEQAIYSKLREAGIQTCSDKFIVAHGADPICTPGLFVLNLLEMLKMQVKGLLVTAGTSETTLFIDHPVLSILTAIATEGDIAENARKVFPDVINLSVLYDSIKEWQGTSAFAQSLDKKISQKMNKIVLQQLREFIYLLAFGSFNDKNQLWGEWASLKNELQTSPNPPDMTAFTGIRNKIEKYLSDQYKTEQ